MAEPWTEVVVMMHGITPERNPGPHHEDYQHLFLNITDSLAAYPDKPKLFRRPIEVEWGWEGSQSDGVDARLAEAERKVLDSTEIAEKAIHDPTLNPLGVIRLVRPVVRSLLILAFADMFYYVSKDGEAAIRKHVFTYLADEIKKAKGEAQDRISLTFIGHSGGGIIFHDLLYHLFRAELVRLEKEAAGEPEFPGIQELRDWIADGQLRLRRFYTLGSPITPLMFRSDSLVKKLADGLRLNPEDIGLREKDGLSNPRWMNIVDKDDFASYPLEFLYENPAPPKPKIITDRHVDVSDNPIVAHGSYWASRALAEYIAETF